MKQTLRSHPRAVWRAAGLTVALCAVCVWPVRSAQPEVRALWVTRTTLTSPASVERMVRAAQSGGFNTLIVQVRGRCDAYYRTTLEPRAQELITRPDFDPLAEILARAKPAGLKVHAWINVNLVSSAVTLPSSRQHVIYRHPEWLMVPKELASDLARIDPIHPEYLGRLAEWTRAHLNEVEGLFTSPLHPAVASHVARIAAEIVTNYRVDGVHIDYARFPNADFDYSHGAVQQFKLALRPHMTDTERRWADAHELVDPLAYPNLFPGRWVAFRQSRLTMLLARVRTLVKEANPGVIVSAAVLPDVTVAAESRMQDWRTWLNDSLIDVLCPMTYTPDVALFERQITAAREFAGARPVWAGVGAYRLTSTATLQHIDIARRHRSAGVVLFSYEALVSAPNSATSLAALGRAAFGAGSH